MVRRVLLVTALGAAGCSGGGNPGTIDAPVDTQRREMLEHLTAELFVPAHQELVAPVNALVAAIDAGCDDAARQAWRDAIDRWERVDAVLVGPARMDNKALRDRIYGWPLLNTCGIDREVVAYWGSPDGYDVTVELANVRSLATVEYLLFHDDTAHTCTTAVDGWDALAADLPAARCGLAGAIAADVAVAGQLALDGWTGYAEELAAGGLPSENVVSDSLFYVDKMVKDMKVGEAAGITINACGTVEVPCEREAEHRFADHGSAAIRINLRALREAFTGTTATADGPGFDDRLRSVGADALADRMTASIDAAIVAADALPDSYLGALIDDREAVVALHVALKAITDDLKSEFISVLGLELPDEVAADND